MKHSGVHGGGGGGGGGGRKGEVSSVEIEHICSMCTCEYKLLIPGILVTRHMNTVIIIL